MPANSLSWKTIFDYCKINEHNFDAKPFALSGKEIKKACQKFTKTSEKEVRILCKQDSREDRPDIFKEKGLFLLPVKNGHYNIIKGEGYIDIKEIDSPIQDYQAKLDFNLETSKIGDSEMQHLDFAYAASLVRSFTKDDSLVLTIRGRKYTPKFDFFVGQHLISAEKVQTEVDAGYEGKDQIVLIEAKNNMKIGKKDIIIRQLYYPYQQWKQYTEKKVAILLFNKEGKGSERIYSLRQYKFNDERNYNSIELIRAEKFRIRE